MADRLEARGFQPAVVPSVLAPQLGIGHRGVKTDVRDAQVLSEMSCRMERIPMVHVPSQESRRRKSLLGARESLVKARTLLINSVRGYLRTQMLRVKRTPSAFPTRVRAKYAAETEGVPAFIEAQLIALESLTEQIACVTKQIETIAKKDRLLMRLQTIPGVGPMTSMAYGACSDSVSARPVRNLFGRI